jgi:hypothetical protein
MMGIIFCHDGSYLVVSRGGDQAPQAPVMAGKETAWKTPTMMRTATARYRLALTHAATGQPQL